MITHQVRRIATIHEWRSLPSWFMWKAGQGGVAGGTLPCHTQEGSALACRDQEGM